MADNPHDTPTRELKPLLGDATQVAGGADCVSPAGPQSDASGSYNTLVDTGSQPIEAVITAAKPY